MSKPPRAATGPEVASLHYEQPAVPIGRVLFWVATVVVTVVLSVIISRAIYVGLVRPARDRSATPLYGQGLVLPAEPRLEGIEMMSADRARNTPPDEAKLHTYGWVDRDKKIVRIPIEQAMKLAVEQGWLHSSTAADDQQKPTGTPPAPGGSNGVR